MVFHRILDFKTGLDVYPDPTLLKGLLLAGFFTVKIIPDYFSF